MPKRDKWTASDIPDLTGKVAVVTGASSGIGFETAKELARKGAETVLACRSQERGQRALDAIQTEIPEAKAELMLLDLASLASVERFATEFGERYSRLDVLANNAGVMGGPYTETEDGFERQVGTNHLGHFALTGRLIDPLLATPGARVVNVSSLAHRRARLDLDDLFYERGGYGGWTAYFRTKLLNLLFTYELQRRFEGAGVEAHSLAAHPGFSATRLGDDLSNRWKFEWWYRFFNILVQGPGHGRPADAPRRHRSHSQGRSVLRAARLLRGTRLPGPRVLVGCVPQRSGCAAAVGDVGGTDGRSVFAVGRREHRVAKSTSACDTPPEPTSSRR